MTAAPASLPAEYSTEILPDDQPSGYQPRPTGLNLVNRLEISFGVSRIIVSLTRGTILCFID